ncbi:rhamnogalacturonan endolyase [Sarracenia purpurea var. burkii]
MCRVRANNKDGSPNLSTGMIGKDNAIARHGIHGLYRVYTVSIPGTQLTNGSNTIFLTQSRGSGPFKGIMYDYIRFESPS